MSDPAEDGRNIRHQLFTPASEAGWTTGAGARHVPDLNRFTDEVLFGQVWSRPGLPMRTRSLITVTALIALSKPEQLAGHITGALRIGVTKEELREVILQMAFYVGWPAAYSSVEILDRCVANLEKSTAG
jgi:4-carboxymuconolactone decarboxylase